MASVFSSRFIFQYFSSIHWFRFPTIYFGVHPTTIQATHVFVCKAMLLHPIRRLGEQGSSLEKAMCSLGVPNYDHSSLSSCSLGLRGQTKVQPLSSKRGRELHTLNATVLFPCFKLCYSTTTCRNSTPTCVKAAHICRNT